MHKEHVTPIDPKALTDKELIRFAEDFLNGDGLPRSFQKELLARFALRII